MITYPNQKIIHINKEISDKYFLQVNKCEWMNACNELTYNAFKVYLYLAGNQDGFDLALSPKAIMEEIKMHPNTYTKVIKELTDKGYIEYVKGNLYNFYTVPEETKEDKTNVSSEEQSHSSVSDNHTTVGDNTTPQCESIPHSSGGERYKRDKKDNLLYNNTSDNKLSSVAATQPEKKILFKLDQLSDKDLNSLLEDFRKGKKAGFSYEALYDKYNLVYGELSKELPKKIEDIFAVRKKLKKYKEIKKELDDFTRTSLMNHLHAESEDELMNYLTAIKVEFDPYQLVVFLDEHDIFTYDVWMKDYCYKEDYRNYNYFEWFVMGVNNNLYSQWDNW